MLSGPIETKCLMYVNVNALDLWSLQISLLSLRGGLAKESIREGRAINLASLDKNLRRSSLQLF